MSDFDHAKRARDDALERVERNAMEAWKREALAAVERTCRELPEFFADDIWDRGLDSTREDRALGPIMRTAARNGWCVKTDRVRPSKRSHLSGKPVWKSLIYGQERKLEEIETPEWWPKRRPAPSGGLFG